LTRQREDESHSNTSCQHCTTLITSVAATEIGRPTNYYTVTGKQTTLACCNFNIISTDYIHNRF